MYIQNPKQILIAPLDWGMGHTTRCIPLIRYIFDLGHYPIFAGNAAQRLLIQQIFKDIETTALDGYNISYSATNHIAQAGLLSQIPGIMKTISAENRWLRSFCKDRHIDGIIADNRYGLYHEDVPCVILTHQLQVITGMGRMTDLAVQKIHYKFLNRFRETWVVDHAEERNLAGYLSHPATLPRHTQYIGLLSQFENVKDPGTSSNKLMMLLSGPEPQRSRLSYIFWQEALKHNGEVIFIEGSNDAETPSIIPGHIAYHKCVPLHCLAPLIQQSGMVISRSGYTTIMDLIALHKKAILIPTPAQTEQQYLGKCMHEQGIFYCTKQDGFDLQNAIKQADKFPMNSRNLTAFDTYKAILENWVKSL